MVPTTSQEPYQQTWSFNSYHYYVFDYLRAGRENAITGLQLQVRIKSSGPQHMSKFFVRSLGLPKTLLENANKTGDLNIICKDGSKVPAHSAVLDSIPYFEAKIKDDWSGTGWNKAKKLDLELPHPVDREVLGAFLEYAYGNVGLLDRIDSDASMMQDLFLLAEACGFSGLCSAIEEIIAVDATSAYSWLELLSKVHAEGVCKIREKVKEVVKEDFLQAELWDDLSVEQLTTLEDMARKHKARKLDH